MATARRSSRKSSTAAPRRIDGSSSKRTGSGSTGPIRCANQWRPHWGGSKRSALGNASCLGVSSTSPPTPSSPASDDRLTFSALRERAAWSHRKLCVREVDLVVRGTRLHGIGDERCCDNREGRNDGEEEKAARISR